jgi:PIN domain nuclease of toxin-antitoxin system
MNILVDTQIFIWAFIEPDRFTQRARSFIEGVDTNQFFLSDASVWEASIKFGLGKLQLPEPPELFFPDRVRLAEYRHLPIDIRHITRVHSLPRIHGDPFDRMLVSQAQLEGLTILSSDRLLKAYKTDTLLMSDIS